MNKSLNWEAIWYAAVSFTVVICITTAYCSIQERARYWVSETSKITSYQPSIEFEYLILFSFPRWLVINLFHLSDTLHLSSTCNDSRFSHKSLTNGSSLLTRTISSISLWLIFSYFLSPWWCLTSLQISSAFSRSALVNFTFPTPSVAFSTEYTLTKRWKMLFNNKWCNSVNF